MSAYVSQLNQLVDATACKPKARTLRDRFIEWYDSLPEVSRNRAFAMVEFEQALQTQGKYLSPILLQLGWERKRKWSTVGQYHRYWVIR